MGCTIINMKQLFLFFFIACAVTSKAQTTVTVKWSPYIPPATGDTMYYNNSQKLTWKDFKGKPDLSGDALAITSSGFGYTAGASNRDGKAYISINVYCYFSKQKSWVIKGKESDYALNHEQHHFDVTWIVANTFFKKLKAAKFTWNNYNQLLDEIYQQSMEQLENMQNAYDGETRNGRLQNIQLKWNTKIEDMLKGITIN